MSANASTLGDLLKTSILDNANAKRVPDAAVSHGCYTPPFNVATGNEYGQFNRRQLLAAFSSILAESSVKYSADAEDFTCLPGFLTFSQAKQLKIKIPKGTKSATSISIHSKDITDSETGDVIYGTFKWAHVFWIGHLVLTRDANPILFDTLTKKKAQVLEAHTNLHANILTQTAGIEYIKSQDSLRGLALRAVIKDGILNASAPGNHEKMAKAQEIFESLTGASRDKLDLCWPASGLPSAELHITTLRATFPNIVKTIETQMLYQKIAYIRSVDYYIDFVCAFVTISITTKRVMRFILGHSPTLSTEAYIRNKRRPSGNDDEDTEEYSDSLGDVDHYIWSTETMVTLFAMLLSDHLAKCMGFDIMQACPALIKRLDKMFTEMLWMYNMGDRLEKIAGFNTMVYRSYRPLRNGNIFLSPEEGRPLEYKAHVTPALLSEVAKMVSVMTENGLSKHMSDRPPKLNTTGPNSVTYQQTANRDFIQINDPEAGAPRPQTTRKRKRYQ